MQKFKKILSFFIIFLFSFYIVGCGNEEKNNNKETISIEESLDDVDYYVIDKQEVEIEELIDLPDNKNVVEVANDKYNFWISNGVDAKRLFGYDLVDEEYILEVVEDINDTRKNYGLDLSKYLFIRLVDNEKLFYNEIEGTNKPTVIVRLSSFCDACDNFDFSSLEEVEKNKEIFNYIYVMDNEGIEDQLAYMQERNVDLNKVYVAEGSLEGLDVIENMSTPGLMFISSDGCLRALLKSSALDGVAMCSWLNAIGDYYFPLKKESLKYAHIDEYGEIQMIFEEEKSN